MSHVNVAHQRLDFISVSDESHEKYMECGVPVLLSTKAGKVVEKEVSRYTMECPECEIDGTYDGDSEPVCPNCGLLLCEQADTTDMITTDGDIVVADPDAADRIADGYQQ